MSTGWSTRDAARTRLRFIEREISTILRAFPELRRRRGRGQFRRVGGDGLMRVGERVHTARLERLRIVR